MIKVDELNDFLKSEPFNFIRLLDSKKGIVIPFNLKSGEVKAQGEKMTRALRSKLYEDGVYYLCFRSTIGGSEQKFPIIKGEPPPGSVISENGKAEKMTTEKDDFLTYDKALELNTRIIQLEVENDRLQERVNEFESELSEDAPAQGSELITVVKEICLPLLDKFFTLYEKNLQLKENEQKIIPPPPPPPPASQPAGEDDKEDVYNMIINGQQEDLVKILQECQQESKEAADNFILLLTQLRPDSGEIINMLPGQ